MKAIAGVTAFVAGAPVNVAQICRECGISRKTFYKYAARCREEGLDGFEERSRRPHRVVHAVSVEVEEAVIRWRKQLADSGLDHGATTIQWHLGRERRVRVPSVATVHRILVRRGFVTPQPHKRPKTTWRRFEANLPNERWQIDHTDWTIASGLTRIFNIVDDHSRLVCRSRAVSDANGDEAWTTFCQAAQLWGLPAAVLSDNGLCFSGKLRGLEVLFEAHLRDAGITPIAGRPYHPQTTGKVERFQQTLKKWLRRQDRTRGLACDLNELQTRLDEFCVYYNQQRPHQGIGRVTPLSRWQQVTAARPAAQPLPHPAPRPEPQSVTINSTGMIRLHNITIGIGVEWAGTPATLLIDGRYATVFSGDQLVRHLRIDHTRRYQPTGRPRGGTRRPRHLRS
jgi:transposase InsO family protein